MIVSFFLNKVHLEKKDIPANPVKIETQNNVRISNISEQKLAPIAKEKALKFDFIFGVRYEPNVAEATLDGGIIFLTDENKMKEILDKWHKEKKINAVLSQHIINFIMSKCNVRVLQWAQDLNLPPHIPFPRITTNVEEN